MDRGIKEILKYTEEHINESKSEDVTGNMLHTYCNLYLRSKEKKYLEKAGKVMQKLTDKIGWGLGEPWNAFQDGHMNSADTIYTYTSAIVLLGALKLSNIKKDYKLFDWAEIATRKLIDRIGYIKVGQHKICFWYSDSEGDRKSNYLVYNTTAYFASLLAKLYGLAANEYYENLAYQSFEWLLANEGNGYWKYGEFKTPINDPHHHGLIIEALAQADELTFAGRYKKVAKRAMEKIEDKNWLKDNGSHEWGYAGMLLGAKALKDKKRVEYLEDIIYKNTKNGRVFNGDIRGQSWTCRALTEVW